MENIRKLIREEVESIILLEEDGYRGFKNYQTHYMYTYLTDEVERRNFIISQGKEFFLNSMSGEDSRLISAKSTALYRLSEHLKEHYTDTAYTLVNDDPFQGLLSYALQGVNWYEIVEHIITDDHINEFIDDEFNTGSSEIDANE